MKSIANQYRDLKEGKLSQFNFMRNLRMSMPQYVTNTTSFNDAIRILKSKSILTEAMDIQPVPEADEDFSSDANYDAMDIADTAAEELAKSAGSYDAAVGMLQDEMGLSSSAAEAIASRVYPEGGDDDTAEIDAMIAQAEEEESGKYTKFQDIPGAISEAKEKVDANRIHPQELNMGIKVEMEHTKDAEKAKKIALDH